MYDDALVCCTLLLLALPLYRQTDFVLLRRSSFRSALAWLVWLTALAGFLLPVYLRTIINWWLGSDSPWRIDGWWLFELPVWALPAASASAHYLIEGNKCRRGVLIGSSAALVFCSCGLPLLTDDLGLFSLMSRYALDRLAFSWLVWCGGLAVFHAVRKMLLAIRLTGKWVDASLPVVLRRVTTLALFVADDFEDEVVNLRHGVKTAGEDYKREALFSEQRARSNYINEMMGWTRKSLFNRAEKMIGVVERPYAWRC